jgi:hypothetical protein
MVDITKIEFVQKKNIYIYINTYINRHENIAYTAWISISLQNSAVKASGDEINSDVVFEMMGELCNCFKHAHATLEG